MINLTPTEYFDIMNSTQPKEKRKRKKKYEEWLQQLNAAIESNNAEQLLNLLETVLNKRLQVEKNLLAAENAIPRVIEFDFRK